MNFSSAWDRKGQAGQGRSILFLALASLLMGALGGCGESDTGARQAERDVGFEFHEDVHVPDDVADVPDIRDVEPVDLGPQCQPGEELCGERCVDSSSDPAHCGACGQACGPGEACLEGECTVQCPGGQEVCQGRCVDLDNSPHHCGGCEQACGVGEVCSNSVCQLTCAENQIECGGVCRDGNVDPGHCGQCDNACAEGLVCSLGECEVSCGGGLVECDGVCRDLATDRQHCGGCGEVCPSGQVCSGGQCEVSCQGDFVECDGVCRDLSTDRFNCGSCATTCATGQVCSDGECEVSCGGDLTECDGVCRDLSTDRLHCGACAQSCAAGQICEDSQCRLSCAQGLNECDGVCRDWQTDRNHCGSCGNACADGRVCTAGSCLASCPSGQMECDGGCFNLSDSSQNCGSCGNACGDGQSCVDGSCQTSCPSGQNECNGGCFDLSNSTQNCGSCGNACGVGQICESGACVLQCPSGQESCDGVCRNLQTDNLHCGACSNSCSPGTSCVGGGCFGFDDYPRSSEGLTLWLRADRDVNLQDGRVESWLDQSDAGQHASQVVTDARPRLIADAFAKGDGDANPAIRFDGAADFLDLGAGFDDFSDGLTAFIVARPRGANSSERFFDLGRASAADNIFFGRNQESADLHFEVYVDGVPGGGVNATNGYKTDRLRQFNVVHYPDQTVELYDRGEVASGTLTLPRSVNRTMNHIAKSNWSDDGLFAGDIAEVLIYNRALSASERQNIELYFVERYHLYHPNASWISTYPGPAQNQIHEYRLNRDDIARADFRDGPADVSCLAHLENSRVFDGLYTIEVEPNVMVDTWCDMSGGGWTLAFLKNSIHSAPIFSNTDGYGFGAGYRGSEVLARHPAVTSAVSETTPYAGWLDINRVSATHLRLASYAAGTETYVSDAIALSELNIDFGQNGYLLWQAPADPPRDDNGVYYWCGGDRAYTDFGNGQINRPAGAPSDCKGHGSLGSGWDFSRVTGTNSGLTLCGAAGASTWMHTRYNAGVINYPTAGGAQAIWVR